MISAKILVVDDEVDHLSIVQRWLEEEGHEVYTDTNASDALVSVVRHQPMLTITDIRMRHMDGFQLISRIREISDTHVLALTGLNSDEHMIHGLEVGADGYLTKPISRRMFLVRVRSILRRATAAKQTPSSYSDRCLTLDVANHDAQLHGETLNLRPTEFRLLAYLARNSDRVLGHQDLLDRVWGEEGGSLDSLKWYISSLRAKMEAKAKSHRNIVTFPRVGYRYNPLESCVYGSTPKREKLPVS